VSLALKFYTGKSSYPAGMKPGATRIDLEGNKVGGVSDGDAAGTKGNLAVPAPSPANALPRTPARRDSLSSLRAAARKRGGVE